MLWRCRHSDLTRRRPGTYRFEKGRPRPRQRSRISDFFCFLNNFEQFRIFEQQFLNNILNRSANAGPRTSADGRGLRCENSPEPEPTRTRTHQNSEFQNSPAFWLRSGPLRSAAFWVLLRSGRTQNPAFCVLDPCVLLRSGILRSAAFWVLLLAGFWHPHSSGQAQARTQDNAPSSGLGALRLGVKLSHVPAWMRADEQMWKKL